MPGEDQGRNLVTQLRVGHADLARFVARVHQHAQQIIPVFAGLPLEQDRTNVLGPVNHHEVERPKPKPNRVPILAQASLEQPEHVGAHIDHAPEQRHPSGPGGSSRAAYRCRRLTAWVNALAKCTEVEESLMFGTMNNERLPSPLSRCVIGPQSGLVASLLPPMRSLPQQQRSRRRYAAIVDAAAELFATNGFDATTMEAIAATSGSAIGSVYRFFPNKQAVFRAVAAGALELAQAVFVEIMEIAASGESRWHEVLDQAVDAFAQMHRSEAAPRAVFANLQLYGEFAEADQQMSREFIRATTRVMEAWIPNVEPATREVIATMVIQTVSGILVLSKREAPAMTAAMLDHTKLMLRRYIEPWVEVVE